MKWYETHFLDQIRYMDNFIELCKVGFCRAFTWSWISWGILGLWLCFWCLRATGRVQKLWWKLNFVVWTHAFFFSDSFGINLIWFGWVEGWDQGKRKDKIEPFLYFKKKMITLKDRFGENKFRKETRWHQKIKNPDVEITSKNWFEPSIAWHIKCL